MKRIESAWIEQILIFDSVSEMDEYVSKLEASRYRYSIISRDDIWMRIRVRKQYNNNGFPLREE